MTRAFEELAWSRTRLGELVLRRRREPKLDLDVWEVKLDDEFLMSSLFTVAEVELARMGLAAVDAPAPDVVVGGLGLGYTAHAVLEVPRVRSLLVVEALAEVIDWHRRGLVPLGAGIAGDTRCRLVHGDFFALVAAALPGLDAEVPGRRFDAILLDVDHSPRHVLHPSHAALYEEAGMQRLAAHLRPGGVFALWSNAPPDAGYERVLRAAFAAAAARVVSFHNPLQDREATATVYVACKAAAGSNRGA